MPTDTNPDETGASEPSTILQMANRRIHSNQNQINVHSKFMFTDFFAVRELFCRHDIFSGPSTLLPPGAGSVTNIQGAMIYLASTECPGPECGLEARLMVLVTIVSGLFVVVAASTGVFQSVIDMVPCISPRPVEYRCLMWRCASWSPWLAAFLHHR